MNLTEPYQEHFKTKTYVPLSECHDYKEIQDITDRLNLFRYHDGTKNIKYFYHSTDNELLNNLIEDILEHLLFNLANKTYSFEEVIKILPSNFLIGVRN